MCVGEEENEEEEEEEEEKDFAGSSVTWRTAAMHLVGVSSTGFRERIGDVRAGAVLARAVGTGAVGAAGAGF